MKTDPLRDITMNNVTLPGDWKKATVVPIYNWGDRSLVTNYRPVIKGGRSSIKHNSGKIKHIML